MKLILFFLISIFLTNCSKPKTVLICGDHICVNKKEAEQYFEENLTIEVKIIKKKEKKRIDLVQLNLNENQSGKREINIFKKKNFDNELKILNKEEKNIIRKNIRNKDSQKKYSYKKLKKKDIHNGEIDKTSKKQKTSKVEKIINNRKKIYLKNDNIIDICTILEKCNIKEISKYLLKEGNDKDFPDITMRQ